jgi:hypothetical protein
MFAEKFNPLTPQQKAAMARKMQTLAPEEQEILNRLPNMWRDAGREEGLEQGLEQGQLKTIFRLLEHRLGSVSPELTRRVRKLPARRLGDFAAALLDLTTRREIASWLAQPAATSTIIADGPPRGVNGGTPSRGSGTGRGMKPAMPNTTTGCAKNDSRPLWKFPSHANRPPRSVPESGVGCDSSRHDPPFRAFRPCGHAF